MERIAHLVIIEQYGAARLLISSECGVSNWKLVNGCNAFAPGLRFARLRAVGSGFAGLGCGLARPGCRIGRIGC